MLNRRRFLRTAAAGVVAAAALKGTATAQPGPREHETAWATEWAQLVAAAEADGRLALLTWGTTWGGSGFPNVIRAFKSEFPSIEVDLVGESSANVWLGRVRRERRAGTY